MSLCISQRPLTVPPRWRWAHAGLGVPTVGWVPVMLLLPGVSGCPALHGADPAAGAATHFGGVPVLGGMVPGGGRDTRAQPPQPRAAGADTSTSVGRAPMGIFNSRLCRLARSECPSPPLPCLRLPPPAPATLRDRIGPSRAASDPAGLHGTRWDRMGPNGAGLDPMGDDQPLHSRIGPCRVGWDPAGEDGTQRGRMRPYVAGQDPARWDGT